MFTETLKIHFWTDLSRITEDVFDIKMSKKKEYVAKLCLREITAQQLVKSIVVYYELLDRCIDRWSSELIQMDNKLNAKVSSHLNVYISKYNFTAEQKTWRDVITRNIKYQTKYSILNIPSSPKDILRNQESQTPQEIS